VTVLSTSRVTFYRPFRLPSMDQIHGPGTFDVVVEQETLDLVWTAYRLSTTILLPRGGAIEAWPVSEAELSAALAADAANVDGTD
jgi:hypothetical protein